jgi:uncharacterized protein YndB with AHSA1/START domain
MLTREITFPVDADRLWEALADPSSWLGADVEWDLRPGGAATFRGGEEDRAGRVDEVQPGRHLSFHWWPEAEQADESTVTWDLEPTEDGTRLTITERRTASPAGASPTGVSPAQASADGWTAWDSRLAGLWVWVPDRGRADRGQRESLMAERRVLAGSASVRLGA